VPNCKYFLVTEAERKHVNNMETRAVIKFPPPARQGAKGNSRHSETLGEHALLYATVKNWVTSLHTVIFPPAMRLVLDDPKQ